MENFSESFEELLKSEARKQVRQLSKGQKIKAVVAGISGENIFLDTGGKSEGILNSAELMDAEGMITVKPGDTVEVYFIESKRSEQIFTTRIGSGSSAAHLEEAYRSGIPVDGLVKEERKGGFEITLGGNVRAFCPYSQMGLRRVEDAAGEYIGSHMTFRITQFDENGRNIVLSARAIQEEERERLKEDLRNSLAEGQTITGTVTSLRDFGAFVDIGGVDGLIPLSEIGWSRVDNVHEHFTVGQEVSVVIKSLDWAKGRISLSFKETLTNPWDTFKKDFPIGSKHLGRVSKLAQFGAFVTLLPGVDGLIHISKLGMGRRLNHPREVLEAGQDIEVIIDSINDDERRISLIPSDYQAPEAAEEKERQEYKEFLAETPKEKPSELGSLGALLKARMAEKKK